MTPHLLYLLYSILALYCTGFTACLSGRAIWYMAARRPTSLAIKRYGSRGTPYELSCCCQGRVGERRGG